MRLFLSLLLVLTVALAGCGLLVDSSPPTVEITSPASTILAEETQVVVVANDPDSGIKSISIFVDDRMLDSTSFEADESGAYALDAKSHSVPWPATAGNHVIRVEAVNGYGKAAAAERTVEVSSSASTTEPDEEAPTVGWNTPVAGDIVSGTVALSAYATDDTAVSRVEFFAGSTHLHTDTAAPYSFNWDSTDETVGREDGPTTLTAVAYDSSDRRSEASVNVTLMNSGVPPSLTIVEPGDGGTVGVQFTVRAEILENGTDYDWVPTDGHNLWVRIYDQVGHPVVEEYLTINGVDEPTDGADSIVEASFDLSSFQNELPLDRFDIVVEGTVRVNDTDIALSRRSTVDLKLGSNLPPALLVYAPAAISGSDPVVGDYMTVAGRVTDDSGSVHALEFSMVCDDCGPGGKPENKLLLYLHNPYDFFTTNILDLNANTGVDDSEDWMLRVTAIDSEDVELRNVVGLDVTVDRTMVFSTPAPDRDDWDVVPTPAEPNDLVSPASATWTFTMPAGVTNPVRYVINVLHDGEPVEYATGTFDSVTGEIEYTRHFGGDDQGAWQLELILQDAATGVQATTRSGVVGVAAVTDSEEP